MCFIPRTPALILTKYKLKTLLFDTFDLLKCCLADGYHSGICDVIIADEGVQKQDFSHPMMKSN